MIDRLRQLAIFAKTIDHGSFRGAAKELRLSPSVVSHHIAQLEEGLGVALIYRTTRKLSLTLDGERLLVATKKMLEAVEGELSGLTASAGQPSGEIRITAPAMMSSSVLMDRMAAFQRTYPKIRLTLDFSDLRRELVEDRFDVAIRAGKKPARAPATKTLFQMRRRLVASPQFLERQSAASEPSQIQDWDWLELTPVRHKAIEFVRDGVAQLVRPSTIKASCNDAQALYRLARAGVGVAIVPELLASEDEVQGLIEFVLPSWQLSSRDVFAEWPSNAPRQGLVRLLVGELSSSGQDPI